MRSANEPAKIVANSFHGEGDTDAGVVTESSVGEKEKPRPERGKDPDVARIEANEDVQPGP